jgi:adenylate cyclase
MEFRIGVNLGDVIEEEGRIYGDGVNIAARVEAMAEAGGICISGRAYDQVANKLGLEYENLGEHQVKNITTPIRVFRVLSLPGAAAHRVVQAKKTLKRKWRNIAFAIAAVLVAAIVAAIIWNFYLRPSAVEVASVEKMAYPLPDKPSIAVLPFENMSEDSTQDYFSDGLTEQIISTLSKLRGLFVISRSSTFTYKGKPVKVQKVAEDLGVKYVLEGSVKRTADRIRITAQLIDATTGHHVWSERYDREQKDIFAIQDDITMEITKALRIELIDGEQARIWGKHETNDLQAFEKVLQGFSYLANGNKEDNVRAQQLYEEAMDLDPEYTRAHVGLGFTHFFDARFGWVESRTDSIKMAFKYSQKAIELDDTFDPAHYLLACLYLVTRQHEKAIAEAKQAVALNPNGAEAHQVLGALLGASGNWADSIVYVKKAIRLNPFPMVYYFHWLGRAYFMIEQYDDAIATFKKALNVNPDYLPAHAFLAACYSSLDRQAEAESAVKEVFRINPKFTLESYAKTLPYKNKADIERYLAALQKAGLK